MPSAITFLAVAAAVLITSFISGILGMAGGMILMGILLAFLPVAAAMMLHGVTQMASNGWRAWLWRREVDWRVFRGNAYGALLAVALFSAAQFAVSKPAAYLILGATPFMTFLLPGDFKLDVDRRGHSLTCGVICTVLQLLAGVSGPLLDVFFLHSRMDRRAVVATKASCQTLGHLLKIIYFGALLAGAAGRVEWWVAGTMVTLAMIGTTLSRTVLERMNDASFRKWTRWTVMTMGVFYLVSGAWLLWTQ